KETLNAAYTKASSFFGKINEDNFSELAKSEGYNVEVGEEITPMQTYIQEIENPRELIRWMYKANVGDITDKVYELNDKYIVAHLTEIRDAGTLPLETVKKDIEPAVLNQVKAKQLTKKTEDALNGASTLDQVAQKLGKTAVNVENIVFANPIIPGVAQE